MSMIPCPGCGLPRVADQFDSVPCPVCAAGVAEPRDSRPGLAPKAAPDPTAGMPADAGQLHLAGHSEGFPAWFGWVAVFLLGAATGAVALLGWQAANPITPSVTEVANAEPDNPHTLPELPPRRIEVAPMPHEPTPRTEPEPEPGPPPPEPKAVAPAPLPGEVITIEVNQPEAKYSIPFTMRNGERVVLKGKVKHFRVPTLDGGASLDASGLEAEEVNISGKVGGRATLKVNAPNGIVHVYSNVGEKSSVEITAPNGEVKFTTTTTPNRPGSAIDGGSRVVITGKFVDLRGDVNGIETRVTVNLPVNGSLRVAAVRGIATVEYQMPAGKGTPDVTVGEVSPTATFKKAG